MFDRCLRDVLVWRRSPLRDLLSLARPPPSLPWRSACPVSHRPGSSSWASPCWPRWSAPQTGTHRNTQEHTQEHTQDQPGADRNRQNTQEQTGTHRNTQERTAQQAAHTTRASAKDKANRQEQAIKDARPPERGTAGSRRMRFLRSNA